MSKRAVIIIVLDTQERTTLMEAGKILGFETSYIYDFDTEQQKVRWIDWRSDLDHFAMYEVSEGSPIPRFGTRRYQDALQGRGEQGDAQEGREVVSQANMQQPSERDQSSRPAPYEGLRVEGEMKDHLKKVQDFLASIETETKEK